MPTGQKPTYRFLTKTEGDPKYTEIGAAWALAKADTFSASITVNGQKENFLIVKNEPKTLAKKAAKSTPQTPAA